MGERCAFVREHEGSSLDKAFKTILDPTAGDASVPVHVVSDKCIRIYSFVRLLPRSVYSPCPLDCAYSVPFPLFLLLNCDTCPFVP